MDKLCFLIVAAASCLICSGSVQGEHHEKAATLLRSNFLSVDVDQSGTLDKKEFKEFVIANSKADIGPFPMIDAGNMHERAFLRMDSNGDGQVGMDELRARRR